MLSLQTSTLYDKLTAEETFHVVLPKREKNQVEKKILNEVEIQVCKGPYLGKSGTIVDRFQVEAIVFIILVPFLIFLTYCFSS